MSKSVQKLVPVILEKTRERKIPWISETNTLLSARLPDGRSLALQRDSISRSLSIHNEKNVAIDSYVATMVDREGFSSLEDLFETARRQALNIDGAIAGVEQTLLSL